MAVVRPLDGPSAVAALKLAVGPGQDRFVAPNAVTFAQFPFEPGAELYGLWSGDDLAGLMALIDMNHPDAQLDEGDDPDGVYLWRLMVAEGQQRKGLGSAALGFMEGLARDRGRAHLATSAVPGDGTPLPFYEGHGFVRSGRVIDGEVELVKRLDRDPG